MIFVRFLRTSENVCYTLQCACVSSTLATGATSYCFLYVLNFPIIFPRVGMTQVAYLPLQFNVWWVAHMWVLYATIRYPFKVMQSKKILKAVHVGVVIVGVLLPATPVLAGIVNDAIQCNVSGTAGVVLGTPPFTLCLVDDYIIFLLFIAGPNSIIALTGMTGLVLLIWTVHKVAHFFFLLLFSCRIVVPHYL